MPFSSSLGQAIEICHTRFLSTSNAFVNTKEKWRRRYEKENCRERGCCSVWNENNFWKVLPQRGPLPRNILPKRGCLSPTIWIGLCVIVVCQIILVPDEIWVKKLCQRFLSFIMTKGPKETWRYLLGWIMNIFINLKLRSNNGFNSLQKDGALWIYFMGSLINTNATRILMEHILILSEDLISFEWGSLEDNDISWRTLIWYRLKST